MAMSLLEVKLLEVAQNGTMDNPYTEVPLYVAEGGYSPKPGDGVTDVSETLTVYLLGSDAAGVQSSLAAVGRLLTHARERAKTKVGNLIYLAVRVSTETAWWGSEVVDGKITLSELGVEGPLTTGRAEARLTLTRQGFFQRDTLAYPVLLNPNTDEQTLGATIVGNCMDGSGETPFILANYFQIKEEDILGDLPAPIFFRIQNLSSTASLSKVHVGRILQKDKYDFTFSNFCQESSGYTDTSCSGDQYGSASLSSNAETTLFSFELLAPFYDLGGDLFHVLARFRSNGSLGNVKFRLKLLSNGVEVWKGPQKRLANVELIQELGIASLPPGPWWQWNKFTLVVTGQRTTAVTETIQLDFLQFFGRQYAKLWAMNSLGQYGQIYYGGPLYEADSYWGVERGVDVIVYGARSMVLLPGTDNGFLFLAQSDVAASAPTDWCLYVNGEYYPRRSTL
jgi:hypothetical protein